MTWEETRDRKKHALQILWLKTVIIHLFDLIIEVPKWSIFLLRLWTVNHTYLHIVCNKRGDCCPLLDPCMRWKEEAACTIYFLIQMLLSYQLFIKSICNWSYRKWRGVPMRQMISPVIAKETAYIMRNVSNLFLYFFWLLELFVNCFLHSSTSK